LAELAARYSETIRGRQPAGPYFLAGYSLGGVIAYEVARRLRAAGDEVALLALLDTARPGADPKGPARVLHHIGEFAHRAPWTWPAYFRRRWRNRRRRHRSERALYRSAGENGLGGRLERLATEVLPQAWQRYAPEPYDGRAVLFRCAEDIALWRHAPDRGWNALVAGGVETQDIPTTHQDLMHEPAVAVLAERLAGFLMRARDPVAGR